jgi:ferrous iron transport protein B
MPFNLSDIKVGDMGRITGFAECPPAYRQKFLALGLTPGTEFQVIRIAPLGDPIEIRVRGTDFGLHRDEFAGLIDTRLNQLWSMEHSMIRMARHSMTGMIA